jgi:hypothetical protein
MPEEQKTLAIDTSAIVEAQKAQAKNKADLPKTVAIDTKELAERLAGARAGAASPSRPAAGLPHWKWIAAVTVVLAVILLLLVAG